MADLEGDRRTRASSQRLSLVVAVTLAGMGAMVEAGMERGSELVVVGSRRGLRPVTAVVVDLKSGGSHESTRH